MNLLKKLWRLQCKIEISISITSLIIILIDSFTKKLHFLNKVSAFYESINASEKNSDIIAFIAITIGIYISVITIISTSRIPASKIILEHKLDKKVISFVFYAIMMNIVEIIFVLFFSCFPYYELIYFALLIIQIIILIKFMIFILLLCKLNVKEIVKEIDAEEKEKEEMYNILCSIRDK